MPQVSPHCLSVVTVAALVAFISLTAFAQIDAPNDSGNLEQPDLPQAFKSLSSRKLEETYTTIYYNNALIQPAHDQDPRWIDLKTFLGNAANAAYPFDIRLSPSAKSIYALVCDSGPSADPSCSLYRGVPSQKIKPVLKAPGLAFVIPGDGCLYVAGHTDNMFDTRRKYCEDDEKLREVPQPFKRVGLKSETGSNLDIFADRALKQKTETIPPNTFVEVILEDHGAYLVRDEFGITGWVKIAESSACQDLKDTDPIRRLCYAGD